MALISSTPLLKHAREHNYCIGAFNVYTIDMLQSVVEAAMETDSPVILQTSIKKAKSYEIDYFAAAAKVASEHYNIPISLHLDHCKEIDLIDRSINAGYTSVMIDASDAPFDENVLITKKVVRMASAFGINVEAEIGRVGGVEDDIIVGGEEAVLADPEVCEMFVNLTSVDTLAPAIGTAHGIYNSDPKIDFLRIKNIADRVSVPLVLHGGSAIPDEAVKRCISLGMSKMNIATELRVIFSTKIREYLNEHETEYDPRKYLVPAKNALKEFVIQKMNLCGCTGKARYFR